MGVKSYVIGIMLMVLVGIASAQVRPLTSTYAFNGLLVNPAYAGSLNLLSATAVHRAQWINVEGAPELQAITVHNSFYSNRIGIGLHAYRDRIGIHETYSFYSSYAYKIKTSAGILAMGVSGGFDNRTSDFEKLTVYDPRDPKLAGNVSSFSPNFGTGIYFANPKMYIGASVPYILESKAFEFDENIDFSDSRQSRYYYFTGGLILDMTENVKFSPSALLRVQEQNRIAYDLTAMVIFDGIAYAGISVRNSAEITFLAQLILNENIRVGYAYDANTSEITTETTGSHEILVNYRIKLHNYKRDPQCPVYF